MRGGLRGLFAQAITHTQLPSNLSILHYMSSDSIRELNNFLQGHPSGNLTPQFSWVMQQEGPPHQATHHATAKFRGVVIGYGRGTATGPAKKAAAILALQWLKSTRI